MFSAIRQAVEEMFTAQWAAFTPIAYDGVEFQTPEGTSWVRLRVQFGDSFQASMGSSRVWRTPGIAIVQCFSAYGVGSNESLELADKVLSIFQGKKAGILTFRATAVTENRQDNEWWQANAITGFFADEIT